MMRKLPHIAPANAAVLVQAEGFKTKSSVYTHEDVDALSSRRVL